MALCAPQVLPCTEPLSAPGSAAAVGPGCHGVPQAAPQTSAWGGCWWLHGAGGAAGAVLAVPALPKALCRGTGSLCESA